MVASRLSALRRNRDGRIAIGNPFDHLPSLPVRPGTVAVLAVLLGSTAFDSFSARPQWRNFVDETAGSAATGDAASARAGLLVFAGVVAAHVLAGRARRPEASTAQQRRELPGQMAHSLIPIVVGYVFAHYLTYLIERGQQTVILLTRSCDADVNYFLSLHPSLLATIKVGCRGGRAHRRGDRRARPGAAPAAQGATR